jgi:hypothetical protein
MLIECVIPDKARIPGDIWDNRRHHSLFTLDYFSVYSVAALTPEAGAECAGWIEAAAGLAARFATAYAAWRLPGPVPESGSATLPRAQ